MHIPDEVIAAAVTPYVDLQFGRSDARTERRSLPDLFRNSYLDKGRISEKVTSYECCLVLGPKGAGKSALGYHLSDMADATDRFVEVVNATYLPMAEIPRIKTGQQPGSERSTTTWRFILLINIIRLMNSSKKARFKDERQIRSILKASTEIGLPQNTSTMRDISRLIGTEARIPFDTKSANVTIFEAIPSLIRIVEEAQSNVGHILILDGLDSIFLNDERYTDSLASLVQAAYLLNQDLRDADVQASIVILLRNDLFSRISHVLPDIQKFRSDMGSSLDWKILSGAQGRNAPLFQLVNSKAGLDNRTHILDYFPDEVVLAGGHKRVETLKYFLNMTRHTPRDILALFENMRQVVEEGSFELRGVKLSQEIIREGILRYSTEYFLDAVANEFAGTPGSKDLSLAGIDTLRSLRKQDFSAEEFSNELHIRHPRLGAKYRDILEMFFFAGAIGNVVPAKRGDTYLQFFHRRSANEIDLGGTLLMANPLVHAFNIPFSHWAE